MRVLIYAAVVLLAAAGIRVLSSPLRLAVKFLINTALGLFALFLFNIAGGYIGVTLGLNLFSGVIVGLCGPLGIVILLIIRWLTF